MPARRRTTFHRSCLTSSSGSPQLTCIRSSSPASSTTSSSSSTPLPTATDARGGSGTRCCSRAGGPPSLGFPSRASFASGSMSTTGCWQSPTPQAPRSASSRSCCRSFATRCYPSRCRRPRRRVALDRPSRTSRLTPRGRSRGSPTFSAAPSAPRNDLWRAFARRASSDARVPHEAARGSLAGSEP